MSFGHIVAAVSGIELIRVEADDLLVRTLRVVEDVFPERAAASLARERILEDPEEVIARSPQIIIGSWCGKKFRPERVAARAGWSEIPAVRDGELHEIKSPLILQPGPAALTDGLDALHALIGAWAARR